MATKRVLLAFNHHGVSEKQRNILEGQADVRLVEAIDGERNLEQTIEELKPDVLLLDMNLPGLDPMRVMRQLTERYPGLQVLVLAGPNGGTRRARAPNPVEPTPLMVNEDRVEELTPRELEVLTLIAKGADNSEIAWLLSISKRTVETHIHHIYGKLGLKDRTQAVLYAVERGLVNL